MRKSKTQASESFTARLKEIAGADVTVTELADGIAYTVDGKFSVSVSKAANDEANVVNQIIRAMEQSA